MWGLAWSWNPKNWRIGKVDALEDDGRVVGIWWFIGPLALCYDYE